MSNISEKEKQAAITLIEAKIERLTGKKVTYAEAATSSVNSVEQIKKLHEELEALTGKKVMYKENKAAKLKEAVQKFIAENEMTEMEVEEGLGDIIKTAATKVGQVMGTKWNQQQAEKAFNDTYAKTAQATAQKLGTDANTYKAALLKFMMDRGGLAILGGKGQNAEWDPASKSFKQLASKTGGQGAFSMGTAGE